jgi:hypothetical protein
LIGVEKSGGADLMFVRVGLALHEFAMGDHQHETYSRNCDHRFAAGWQDLDFEATVGEFRASSSVFSTKLLPHFLLNRGNIRISQGHPRPKIRYLMSD